MSAIYQRYAGKDNNRAIIALIVVFIISFVTLFSDSTSKLNTTQLAVVIVAGVIYLLSGLEGTLFNPRPAFFIIIGFFAVQILSAEAICYAARLSGATWIIFMPIITYAVQFLSNRGIVVVCGVIVVFFFLNLSTYSPAILWQSILSYVAGIIFVALFSQIALQEQRARVALNEANHKLREYARQAEELAITKERNRVAREIHDSVGHYLTVINVQIGAARAVIERDPQRAKESLEKAQNLTREGLSEIRRSIGALRASPMDNKLLQEAIEELVAESQAAGIATELQVTGTPRPLETQADLTLYRIAQEGLTNIRKHSQASKAIVTLDYSDFKLIRLVIADNGRGKVSDNSGFGLMGIRERVQLLGGTTQVETAPGQGFKLKVELPL